MNKNIYKLTLIVLSSVIQQMLFGFTIVYASETATEIKSGWEKIDKKWYYLLDNAEYAKSMLIDDYWVDEVGIMATDQWIDTGDGEYYFQSDGKMCKLQFCVIEGSLYYFDAMGRVDNTSGLKKEGPDWYYLDENGKLLKSQEVDGIGYFNEEGKLILYGTVFESPLGMQYYGEDGKPIYNRVVEVNETLYYFDKIGIWDNNYGWKKSGDDWFYIDNDGQFVVNDWVGKYYLGENGIMLKNQYANRFYIGEDGRWGGTFTKENWKIDGDWKRDGEKWYFVNSNGEKQEIDFSKVRSIARCGYDYENPDTPPEQSIESYIMAKEKGFNILLCDLRFTADGIPVCYHYDDIGVVARYANGSEIEKKLAVEELLYEELEQYDWGIYKGEKYQGTKLLKLDEILSLMDDLNAEVYVEIKTGNEEQIMQAVNIAKNYGIKISWAGTTLEQCKAVIKADETARVATMPVNITEKEIECLLELRTEFNEVFFFTYDTAILNDVTLAMLKKYEIPFEMGTINSVEEIVNYWNGYYQYCSGIESNCIVASLIDLNEYFSITQ